MKNNFTVAKEAIADKLASSTPAGPNIKIPGSIETSTTTTTTKPI